ncbi:transmembrane protein, putative [Bodo saltans]|uniref:Transmembrane protein, putative n=1 Tax=Bodo saltans TaxID=75058 RepID=A0A0S4ISZ4_BODSA|nr:transmembrane protein, putative [Bodo saltans]|eukprot:CUE96462.1 transmembrane protein, putative [Bodo saltans]
MCVAVSGSTTANTAASCSDFIDAFSCMSSDLTCWFNTTQRACVDMPCSSAAGGSNSSAAGFFCPLPRCRNVSWHCVDACPHTYVLCTATGRCAPSQDLCVSCPASQVQCWDSSCTSSAAACPCPPYLPHRCNSTSACVANQSRCDVVCIATNVICPDLSCAPSLDQCPCPVATPFRCAAKSNACVVDSTACNASCPAAAPVACSNGACAADRNSCACDWTTPVRCPTDGNCYASLLQCPCTNATKRCTTAPYYCAANCDAVPSTCNTTTPVRCANGQCAASLRNCPCVDTAVVPQVSIMSAATTFDASKWLRLSAYVNYSVCGMDRSSDVTIVWTVTGGGRSLSTNGAQLNGTTLALPPNYISVVGQAVTIVAKGIVWTKSAAGAAVSQIVVASMSMKPYAPVPVLEFLGGAQRFVGTSERLVLNVAITDPFWGRRGSGANISWTCCTGANCSDACPANVSAFINAATMPSVVLPNIYAGTYNFTLWYLGNAITQTIIALNGTVANIKLFTRTTVFLARDPTYVYALLPNDIASASRISYSWLINGSSDLAARLRTGDTTDGTVFIIKGGNVLPAGATHNITATITVTWTSASGGTVERQMFGASSMIIVTAVVPQLSCRVSITDGSVNATALTTAVRLSAASSLAASSASITYRFGFVDFTDGSLKWVRDVPLTAAYQDYPLLDLKTPMTVGVGVWNRAVNVTFFAVARLGGVVDAVRANCSLVINPSSANVSTLLSEQKQALDAATTSGDVSSVVSAVASMATLTTAGTNASANRDSFTNVVTALTSAVRGSNATGLSSEQRGAVVQTISSFVAAIGDANITSVNRYRLLTVLVNTINTSTSDADGTSDTAFDPVRDGPTVMATLDQLQLDVNVTKVAERLASSIASNAALGVISTLTSTNISLRAVNALPGAFNGSNLIANRSTIQIPSNFTLFTNASETSVISLRASEYRVNPLGAGGLVNRSLVSSVVDFAIDQDGVQTSVSGLAFNDSILLNISIDVSEDAHNNGTGHKNYTCAFYDYAQSRWSTSGVTTLNVDIASKTVLCGTQHLSTFSVSSNDSTTETAAPSETTTTPAPQTNTTTTTTAPSTTDPNNNNGNDDGGLGGGAIAGIVIGVLVVIGIVVAVIVMKMRGGNSDATNSKHKVGSDGYDRGNQHELPALELPSHHNGPVNQQHNDQFTEL